MFPTNTKILIVDDAKIMRIILKKALTGAGMTNITEADDGAIAWSLIEQALSSEAPFELIISDWNMPQLTGIELLKNVRKNPKTKDLPFVMLTAETEQNQILEAAKLGISSYIGKPFTVNIVGEKLKGVYEKFIDLKKWHK